MNTAIQKQQTDSAITTSQESSKDVLSAGLVAEIQARFTVANRFPRNWNDCRVNILSDCDRPRFAAAARYRKPVGKVLDSKTGNWVQSYAEGPSIRFAESVLRALKNWDCSVMDVYEDDDKKISRVSMVDLEGNSRSSIDVTVAKTIERKKLKQGESPISTRTNSYGEKLYILSATPDEVEFKKANMVAKAKRNLVVQCVPADILEEAMERCIETALKDADADPDSARKKVLDAFASIGVKPSELETYLQHSTDMILPKELEELRLIYTTIREGDAKWNDFVEASTANPKDEEERQAAEAKAVQVNRVLDAARQKVANKSKGNEQ